MKLNIWANIQYNIHCILDWEAAIPTTITIRPRQHVWHRYARLSTIVPYSQNFERKNERAFLALKKNGPLFPGNWAIESKKKAFASINLFERTPYCIIRITALNSEQILLSASWSHTRNWKYDGDYAVGKNLGECFGRLIMASTRLSTRDDEK